MIYENTILILISISAALTAIMGAMVALRSTKDREINSLKQMRTYFEGNSTEINRQKERIDKEGRVLTELLQHPESVTPESLARLRELVTQAAKSLEKSIEEKRAFEHLVSKDAAINSVYKQNIESTEKAVEATIRLESSLNALVAAVSRAKR